MPGSRYWNRQSTVLPKTVEEDDDAVMRLVELTLVQPQPEREQFLRNACAGNSDLFEEVWKYVEREERMNGFLLDPLYPEPVASTFEPGDLLDKRFRIVREVAQGGMGIVYEAVDERLHRRIAIKCAKPGFRRRLPPEIRHASEIAHPNVCKIFEIHTVSTDQGETDFLTMEFLEGETLWERLERGPIPLKQAREIAQQLCAGLAEAHRRGVIHGDLKSNNIILTTATDKTIRAVITDFGLARGYEASLQTVQSGSLRGTPNYMAPELWKGAKSSVASDVYALGVILHELASERSAAETVSALEEDYATRRPPRLKHPWSRIIERCVETDPSRRWSSASEIALALTPSHRLRRWTVAAVAAMLAAVVGAVIFSNVIKPQENLRLAFLPFETSAADRPLSDGLLDDTADRLRHVKSSTTRKLTVIPWDDAVRNKADTLDKVAGLLGATHVLTGTLQRDGAHINIHAYLIDARTRVPLKEWQAIYQADGLRDMPLALAGMVTGTLSLSPLVPVATVNAAAYPYFVRGVGLLERNSMDEALPLLQSAVKADPDSPLTYARLAEAQHGKYQVIRDARGSGGDEWLQMAKASLAQAEIRNPDLAVVRAVSGMINKYEGAYEKAEVDYQRALQIEPLNSDVWRRLGDMYYDLSRFSEAISAYQKAVDLQPGYFKNHQALCRLQSNQANYEEALRECQAMVVLVPQLSEAHFALGGVYLATGRYAEGEQELRSAVNLDPQSSKAYHVLALAMVFQKRYSEAIASFQRALEIGPESEQLYLNLGTTYLLADLRQDAQVSYQKALTIADTVLGRNPRERVLRSHVAYLCARLGQKSRAESEAAQALKLAPGSVEVARVIVQTYEVLGQREQALKLAGTLPDEMLRRLNRSPDSADLPQDPRFQELLRSRHIQ